MGSGEGAVPVSVDEHHWCGVCAPIMALCDHQRTFCPIRWWRRLTAELLMLAELVMRARLDVSRARERSALLAAPEAAAAPSPVTFFDLDWAMITEELQKKRLRPQARTSRQWPMASGFDMPTPRAAGVVLQHRALSQAVHSLPRALWHARCGATRAGTDDHCADVLARAAQPPAPACHRCKTTSGLSRGCGRADRRLAANAANARPGGNSCEESAWRSCARPCRSTTRGSPGARLAPALESAAYAPLQRPHRDPSRKGRCGRCGRGGSGALLCPLWSARGAY